MAELVSRLVVTFITRPSLAVSGVEEWYGSAVRYMRFLS